MANNGVPTDRFMFKDLYKNQYISWLCHHRPGRATQLATRLCTNIRCISEHLKRAHVVHLDLKDKNVLVKGDNLTLFDFDIAQVDGKPHTAPLDRSAAGLRNSNAQFGILRGIIKSLIGGFKK